MARGSQVLRPRVAPEVRAEGITQVVCLAAGSDTRAWRLGLPPATRFF
ncbi:class I SAM-dependent methyltransferase, partial [Streptomyces exfoliatus]